MALVPRRLVHFHLDAMFSSVPRTNCMPMPILKRYVVLRKGRIFSDRFSREVHAAGRWRTRGWDGG